MMVRYVLKDLTEVFCYLPWALAGGCICLLLLGLRRRGRCGAKKAPALAFALFVMYLIILSGLVFFGRPPGSRHGLALGLFDTFGNLRSNAYVLENVFLFVPFGLFFGYFQRKYKCSASAAAGKRLKKDKVQECKIQKDKEQLAKRHLKQFAAQPLWRPAVYCGAVSCAFSILIEIVQYIFSRGFTQLDDVLTNTLGGIAGYGLYRLYRGFYSKHLT